MAKKKASKMTHTDPIDDALAEKEKLAAERKAQDFKAWEQWKQNPNHDTMDVLMSRFDPVLKSKARLWKAPNVNQAAFLTNLHINAVKAFETYDPTRGASLRTHLDNSLRPAMRFNIQHQNYAYMPEDQVTNIGRVQKAQDALQEELGRAPTPREIANYVNPELSGRRKLTDKKVTRILENQRKDIIGSTFESDPTPYNAQREREVASLLRPSLNPDQQQVFDYLYGENGKPRIGSTTAIAKALGKSPSQISRLRTDILKKFDENL